LITEPFVVTYSNEIDHCTMSSRTVCEVIPSVL